MQCPVIFFLFQCWCWQDRGVHLLEHRVGEDAVRGGGRRLPDCEDLEDPKTCHGANGGPVSVLLQASVAMNEKMNSVENPKESFFLSRYTDIKHKILGVFLNV